MLAGKSLTELAIEIERQKNNKKDYTAPANMIEAIIEETQGHNALVKSPRIQLASNGGPMGINAIAHDQFATYLKVPRDYYKRMIDETPELLVQTLNAWLHRKGDERRMVRTLDGNVRAILSDRYRPLDNDELAEAVLPILGARANDGLRIESCEITERRLYIKAVFPKVQAVVNTIQPGRHEFVTEGNRDIIQSGVVIQNSEVGMGAIAVQPMIFRLACYNGLIVADEGTRKYHIGGSTGADSEAAEQFFKDETRMARDKALFLTLRDTVDGALSQDTFNGMVDRINESAQRRIDADPVKVVEVVKEKVGLSEKERGSVLQHLIQGGDLTQWGLVNAITRTANDAPSYDRATELETLGGRVAMDAALFADMVAVASK